MRINVHAGHNPDGKVGCGAIGLIKESTENRVVKDEVIRLLKALGHTVYDCTVDNGKSSSDVLSKIVAKCNAHTVDLDVSIHFNACVKDYKGDGKTTGTGVYVCKKGAAYEYANNICKCISALGFKNRGVTVRPSLYVLKHTKAPALLVECCFCDDKDDVAIYKKDKAAMARAIVKGITGQEVTATPAAPETPEKPATQGANSGNEFMVKVNVNGLNIRAAAGAENKVTGCIKDKGTYTIVKTAKAADGGTWGKLKSGIGWINISSKFVTRV